MCTFTFSLDPLSGARFSIYIKPNGQFSALGLSLTQRQTQLTSPSFSKHFLLLPPETPQAALLANSSGPSPMLECSEASSLHSPPILLLTSFSPTALNTSQTPISTSSFCPELQTHMVNCLLDIFTQICLKHNTIYWASTCYFMS